MILHFIQDGIQAHTEKMPVLITPTALGVLKNLFQHENPAKLNVFLDFPIFLLLSPASIETYLCHKNIYFCETLQFNIAMSKTWPPHEATGWLPGGDATP